LNRVKLCLSNRLHVPVFRVDGVPWSFPLWKFSQARQIANTGLHLDCFALFVMLKESPSGHYLPPFSLKGKTVLDAGACCGETAYYFLKHGAAKVIAVECDAKRIEIIRRNVKALNLNVEVVPEPFSYKHLLEFDFIKCDCEGAEVNLLNDPAVLKPCVVETHSRYLTNMFLASGFSEVCRLNANQSLLVNY
jgi:methylase of polypeptide subunit release factors